MTGHRRPTGAALFGAAGEAIPSLGVNFRWILCYGDLLFPHGEGYVVLSRWLETVVEKDPPAFVHLTPFVREASAVLAGRHMVARVTHDGAVFTWAVRLTRCGGCGAVFAIPVGLVGPRTCESCEREHKTATQRVRRERRRPPLPRRCVQCGEPMTSTRTTRQYCSGRCRVAAHREAQR